MKFMRLKRRLKLPSFSVVGVLESIWLFTCTNAPLGDLGKFSNEDIAIAIDWADDPDELVAHLIECGWLDTCNVHRLLVHDWEEHCPTYVRGINARKGLKFAEKGKPLETVAQPEPEPSLPKVPTQVEPKVEPKVPPQVEPREAPSYPNLSYPNQTKPDLSQPFSPPEAAEGRADPPAPAVSPKTKPPLKPKADKPPPKPREPDLLFDALVALTGSDASVTGPHIGRVRKLLLAADPPYTPAEVLRMADPAWQSANMPWLCGRSPTLGEVEKYIGRVRNPSATKPKPATKAESQNDYLAQMMADCVPSSKQKPLELPHG
jgi:hypothetical protein